MVAAIGAGLDFYRQALALRAYRQEILSADIANASTPGFKAVDLDFAGALETVSRRSPTTEPPANPKKLWLVDNARHIDVATGAPNPAASFVKYQVDSEVTLDGNSVDLDQEKVTAAENAVQYEADATFATQTVRMLTIAINGSGSQQSSGG
jgi:flagellar basal-body rod protein FlgB